MLSFAALFAGPALAEPAAPAVPDAVVPALPEQETPAPAPLATDSTSSEPAASADISVPRMPATEFPYPTGASGPGRVVLDLVVEKDGTLRSARV